MYTPANTGSIKDPAVLAEFFHLSGKVRAWVSVDHNEDGTHHVPVLPESVPLGAMVMWGSNTAPEKWLLCDGSTVSRSTYQGLFAVIGTTYGAGDGSTTFNVPNLQQRMPLGKAASGTGATLGSTGGSIDHTHAFSGGTTGANGGFSISTGAGGSHDHGGNTGVDSAQATVQIDAGGGDPWSASAGPHTHSIGSASDHTHTVTQGDHTHTIGSGSTDADNQAYLVVQFIILAGV